MLSPGVVGRREPRGENGGKGQDIAGSFIIGMTFLSVVFVECNRM